MKNHMIGYGLMALLLTVGYGFTGKENTALEAVYGVANGDPSRIELSLRKDFTFTYQDYSEPLHGVNVQGTYTVKNTTVLLLSDDGQPEFHTKWKLSDSGMTASSRKGLTFYTLRKK